MFNLTFNYSITFGDLQYIYLYNYEIDNLFSIPEIISLEIKEQIKDAFNNK